MHFIDWEDRNAHAAAECAVRLMRENYNFDGACQEAARRYSAPLSMVRRWFSRLTA